MTEAKWLACADGLELYRVGRSTYRQRLLVTAACLGLRNKVPESHPTSTTRLTVADVERCADAKWEEFETDPLYPIGFGPAPLGESPPNSIQVQFGPLDRPQVIIWSVCDRADLAWIVRDIFGNPFRPVAFAPEWRTDTVVALAWRMYESGDFSAMPILADALQDAGCDSEDVLNHCREPSRPARLSLTEPGERDGGGRPHVRGCWVIDLVLGKE